MFKFFVSDSFVTLAEVTTRGTGILTIPVAFEVSNYPMTLSIVYSSANVGLKLEYIFIFIIALYWHGYHNGSVWSR